MYMVCKIYYYGLKQTRICYPNLANVSGKKTTSFLYVLKDLLKSFPMKPVVRNVMYYYNQLSTFIRQNRIYVFNKFITPI